MAEQIAFITGANKGIGFAAAQALGKRGYTVLLGVRDTGKGEEAVSKLRGHGVNAEVISIDLSDTSSIEKAAAEISAKYNHLDVLINNAGVNYDGEDFGKAVVSEGVDAQLRATFDTNFFGPITLTKALLPLLKKSPAGRIVNVSSILGSLTFNATPGSPTYASKLFAYNASKTALNSFTIHLAYELQSTNIKVNSAHPGWVQTDLGGPHAPMSIEEGAKTLVDLATLGADGVNGGFVHLGQTLPW